jgi:death on curing protein
VDGVRYLTVDQVIEFHAEALREFGGLDGIRSANQLAAAVLMAQQSAFGEDAYPGIPDKAAAYALFIAEAQAFIDGNKRTAAIAMEAFLLLNGYELRMPDDEIAELFEKLGSHAIGRVEFFDAISTHAFVSNP